MNKLVDHLFVFEGNGKVKDFYGNYTEYRLEKQKAERRKQKAEGKKEKGEGRKDEMMDQNSQISNLKSNSPLTWKERRELEQLEIEIPKLEEEKEILLQKMNSGVGEAQDFNDWGIAYQNLAEAIEGKTMRWLELSEKG